MLPGSSLDFLARLGGTLLERPVGCWSPPLRSDPARHMVGELCRPLLRRSSVRSNVLAGRESCGRRPEYRRRVAQLVNTYIFYTLNAIVQLLYIPKWGLEVTAQKTEHDSCERPPTYISVFYIYSSSTELSKDLTLLYSSVVALRKLVYDG